MRLYGRRWNKARLNFLEDHPFCVYCEQAGRSSRAVVVDHIKAHKQDKSRFWDESNWQALCETCHNAVKQAEERSGFVRGAGSDGAPLDPNHHWNK